MTALTVTVVLGIGIFLIYSWLFQPVPAPTYIDLQEQAQEDGGIAAITPPRPVADFSLTSHTGDTVSLSDYRGNVIVLFFGYTHCPDVCPLTLHEMARTHDALGDQAESVSFLFISVDGERDTPEWLGKYLETRGVDSFITGLTGTEGEMRAIGADYGLYFEKNDQTSSQASYLVDHTASSFLIDAEGRLAAIMAFGTPTESLTASIRAILPTG